MNSILKSMKPFIAMEILERACKMEQEGADVIHFEVGEPDFDMPDTAGKAAVAAQNEGYTHYTHSLGDIALRREIARMYKKEYGVEVDPECIVVTSGSSPAILLALMVLCDVGEKVIISDPGYPCYKNLIYAVHAQPVPINVSAERGFIFDVEELRKYSGKAAALLVNSPMNPSGHVVDEDTYRGLVSLGIPVISDEIYHGLVYEGKAHSILEYTDEAFVINGLSKRYAMTGLRIGYLIAPKRYMRDLQTLQQNLFICASSTAQKAALVALRECADDEQAMCRIYNERRIYLLERLKNMGFGIKIEPQGAFYIFADMRCFADDSFAFALDVLENAHVGITPGIDFGANGEGFVRFSYANSMENLRLGMDRLENYLKNRGKGCTK